MRLLFTIAVLALLTTSCSTPSKKQEEHQDVADQPVRPINELPRMTATLINRSSVNLHNLKGNTMIILFQPDCDHCQREAQQIRQHLDNFKDYTLYFISADQLPAIEAFGKTYDLLGFENVVFGSTTVDSVISNFGPVPAPSVYIYSNQKLVQKFNGEVAIERILETI
jgi:peroxiredoxin